jgi:hypothetical protein
MRRNVLLVVVSVFFFCSAVHANDEDMGGGG